MNDKTQTASGGMNTPAEDLDHEVRRECGLINDMMSSARVSALRSHLAIGDRFIAFKEFFKKHNRRFQDLFDQKLVDCSQDTAGRYMNIAEYKLYREILEDPESAILRKIPKSHTTLAVLTGLPRERFLEFVESGEIHREMKGQDAQNLVAACTPVKAPKHVWLVPGPHVSESGAEVSLTSEPIEASASTINLTENKQSKPRNTGAHGLNGSKSRNGSGAEKATRPNAYDDDLDVVDMEIFELDKRAQQGLDILVEAIGAMMPGHRRKWLRKVVTALKVMPDDVDDLAAERAAENQRAVDIEKRDAEDEKDFHNDVQAEDDMDSQKDDEPKRTLN